MLWGVGVVSALGLVTWWLHEPGSAPLGRAFGVLALYGGLFWLSLLKVWWTAGRSAVILSDDRLSYRPLHSFGLRSIELAGVQLCAPRKSTESLRLIHQWRPGEGREFFLNLAIIDGRHEFLDELGRCLERKGLVPVAGESYTWRRPGRSPEESPSPEAG